MTREESVFLGVLLVNLVLAVIYLLYGLIFAASADEEIYEKEGRARSDGRSTYVLRFTVMVLCPVVGLIFFFVSWLLYKTIFRFAVNLDDITFSKERVNTQVKADEEQERNIIPIEEALAVNDKKSLRRAMLNILRGETDGSLASIALALDSGDSETAHYAASVLSDKLNEFRMNARRLQSKIQEDPEDTQSAEELIDYMGGVLKQQVFTPLEQSGYVKMMEEVAEFLYQKDVTLLSPERYENVCLCLMEMKEFEASERWCLRLAEQYPDTLCAYTCRLKLFFETKNKKEFFQTIDNLKKADVVIDSETLEMIRIFS